MSVPVAAAAAAAPSFASSFGGQVAGQAIGSASSGLFGQLFGGWNARRQWKYAKKQMALQQQYQLEQMQKSYELQQSMFDYENAYNEPTKVFERYRAAGINPSAVLGSSGASMSATMSPSSGPSGGSISGGSPVHPAAPVAGPNSFLEASQIRLNDAQADELSTRSDLNSEKAVTESSVRNMLSAAVDEKTMNAYFLHQRSAYQSLVNSRYDEFTDAQVSEMTAHADNLVASANLSTEQVGLVRAQVAETLMRGALESAMTSTQTELGKLYRSESGFVSLQAEDLRNNIKALSGSRQLRVQRVVIEEGKPVLKSHTVSVDAYQARSLAIQMGAELGANEAARSFIVADWEKAGEIRKTVTGYVNSASGLINSVSNVLRSAKSLPSGSSEERSYVDQDGQFVGGYSSYRRYK